MFKVLILTGLLVRLTSVAHAQGQLILANNDNTSADPAATSNGLFWLSTGGGAPVLIKQDFNAAFYGGTDSSALSLLATFLLTDGTAAHDNAFGPGTFVDPTGKAYTFPSSSSVFVRIQAWTENFNSYAAAVSGGASAAQSPVFINPVDVPPGSAVPLVGMPALVMSVPEPSSFAFAALGGLYVLLLSRRRRNG
jgi:hypothetical protein